MSKKKAITLSAEEMSRVQYACTQFQETLEAIERAKQFKLGDFVIQYHSDYNGGWDITKNSYGAPTKYQVVHVSENGLPFMKQVNAKGTPVGELLVGIAQVHEDDFLSNGYGIRWELDPDYADALLLQDEYDHAQLHKNKKEIWKEVTAHNKACKINTQDIASIVDFFKTLKVGDMMYTSNVSHYMVREIKTLSKADANKVVHYRWVNRVKGPHVLVLNVVDKNGKVKDIAADFFFSKALYKERPRTYKELNI